VATPPTVKEIEEVLTNIIKKTTKCLERQKIIFKDDNDGGFQMPIPNYDTLSKLQATSVTYLQSPKSDCQLMIMAMSHIGSKNPKR
jgi:hypothetical protein